MQFLFYRVSSLPPILSLIYDYDENGVLLKRQKEMNGTIVDLGEKLFIPTDNLTMLWNISRNDSGQVPDEFSLHDLLHGNKNRILILIIPFPSLLFPLSHLHALPFGSHSESIRAV